MSKYSIGRVINAMVAVVAANKHSNLSPNVIGEVVGLSPTGVMGWLAQRTVIDGAYLDAIEERLVPMVKANIDANRLQILADLGDDYGNKVAAAIARSSYGTAARAAVSRRAGYETRGCKFRPETVSKKTDLLRKVKWIASEMHPLPYREIADRLGIAVGTVSGWIRGDRLPSLTFSSQIVTTYDRLRAEKKEMLKDAGVTPPEAPKPVAQPRPDAVMIAPPVIAQASPPVVAPPPAPKRIDPIHMPSAMIRINADGAGLKVRGGTTLLIEDGEYLDLQELGTHTFRLTLPNNLSVRLNK